MASSDTCNVLGGGGVLGHLGPARGPLCIPCAIEGSTRRDPTYFCGRISPSGDDINRAQLAQHACAELGQVQHEEIRAAAPCAVSILGVEDCLSEYAPRTPFARKATSNTEEQRQARKEKTISTVKRLCLNGKGWRGASEGQRWMTTLRHVSSQMFQTLSTRRYIVLLNHNKELHCYAESAMPDSIRSCAT